MYCVIQEIELKKASKGNSKRLEVYTWDWTINGKYIKKYTYRKSSECFDRPNKKAYKISIHVSYRENGVVKKKQWHIGTWEHYILIEYRFELWKIENKLTVDITEDELYEIIYKKLDPLIEKITKEYHKTEEYEADSFMSDIAVSFMTLVSDYNSWTPNDVMNHIERPSKPRLEIVK